MHGGLMIRLFLAAWLILTASGCGFQLRGQTDLPRDLKVYIQSKEGEGIPPSQLRRTLMLILKANGVTVAESPEAADATLKILEENLRRRTLATGPNGEVREYELSYSVDYAISLADGTQLVPKSDLTVYRDLLYGESDVLGRAEGEEIAIREMLSDVAYSILRRVSATRS